MVRSFIRAATAEAGPWMRRVLPCWMVRGSSDDLCASRADKQGDSQRTLTGYLGTVAELRRRDWQVLKKGQPPMNADKNRSKQRASLGFDRPGGLSNPS